MKRHLPSYGLLLVLSFLYATGACSQTPKIDSLKKELGRTRGASRVGLLLNLCGEFSSMNADSLYKLALEVKQLNTSPAPEQFFLPEYYISRSMLKRGLLDSATTLTDNALDYLNTKKLDNIRSYRMFMATKANLLVRKNEYKEAIQQFDRLLRNAEKNKDIEFQNVAITGIGWVYMEMGRYRDALTWFYKALKNGALDKDQRYAIIVLSNMGAVYNTVGQHDSGMHYINRAITIAEKHQDLTGIANALNIQASIFLDAHQNEKAEAPLNRALEIRKQVGDPFYIISDISQLASYYAHNNKPEEGIALARQGIDMANRYGLEAKLRLLYGSLAENYKAAGDMAGYSETLETILALNDSLHSRNTTADLARIHANYELQKKENIIIKQELDIVRKNYLFYGSLSLLLITGGFSFILFRNFRRKQKLQIHLLMQEEKQLMEDAVREAEENERKRIAADLHDNLGVYAAAIASNIDTAIRSEGSREVAMAELKTNSQAMVAQLSDTIWVLKKDSLSLTAISDRIKVFMQRMQASYPHITMEVREGVENDILLSPSQAYHLFSIVQEGVNNAIKHSGGTEVLVLIESGGTWKVEILDNGKGFSHTGSDSGSNGLYNMESRATGNNWLIRWEKNKDGGTKVVIQPKETV